MFRNEYQGGACVEVFSAQEKAPLAHWKLTGSGIKKLFEKEVKSYVYSLEGTAEKTKMQLPKEIKVGLYLIQCFLVFQVHIPATQDFALELSVHDNSGQRRRLILSTVYKETRPNPLHCQIPLGLVKRATWLNLCVDLQSLLNKTWPDTTFQSLETISVSGCCKLRRIFTMRRQTPDTTDDEELYGVDVNMDVELESIPKHCQLPPDVIQQTQVINWLKVRHFEGKAAPVQSTAAAAAAAAAAGESSGTKTKMSQKLASNKQSTLSVKQSHARSHSDVTEEISSGRRLSSELRSDIVGSLEREHTDPGSDAVDSTRCDGTDASLSVPFVQPHPPRGPSSGTGARRKIRVRSTGSDITPPVSANGNRQNGFLNHRQLKPPVNINVVATDDEVDQIMDVLKRKSATRSESESESSHCESVGAAEAESDESITDVINALKDEQLTQPGDRCDADRVYMFSSRPTSIPAPRAKTKQVALELNKKQLSRDVDKMKSPASEIVGGDSDVDSSPVSEQQQQGGATVSRHGPLDGATASRHGPLEGATASRHSSLEGATLCKSPEPQRQSVLRSSLREIPENQLRRSGGAKPYVVGKYQAPHELTESGEQAMLMALRQSSDTEDREDESEEENIGGEDGDKQEVTMSRFQFGSDTLVDSSDDETSTLRSNTKCYPKYRASHDYLEEMNNLAAGALRLSNHSEWDSPRTISSPFATLNGYHDDLLNGTAGTLEIPQVTQSLQRPVPNSLCGVTAAGTNHRQPSSDTELLDVLYDADLQCFYDPRTKKYYKLKSQSDFTLQSPR